MYIYIISLSHSYYIGLSLINSKYFHCDFHALLLRLYENIYLIYLQLYQQRRNLTQEFYCHKLVCIT